MLSQREREYVEDHIKYTDKYGSDNAKSVRSRIRRRIKEALEDLTFVIKHDEGICQRESCVSNHKGRYLENMFWNKKELMALIKEYIKSTNSPVVLCGIVKDELEEFVAPYKEKQLQKFIEDYKKYEHDDEKFLKSIDYFDLGDTGLDSNLELLEFVKKSIQDDVSNTMLLLNSSEDSK